MAAIVVLFLLSIDDPLFKWLHRAREVTWGDIAVRLEQDATALQLNEEYARLKGLSYDQIQLFLAVGAKRKDGITFNAPEVNLENLEALERIGLVADVTPNDSDGLDWKTTADGDALHRLILGQVVSGIRNVPEPHAEGE